MKLNRDENLLELKNRTLDLNQVLQDLADKDSNEMGEYLVSNFSIPREIRMSALRMVLNNYVKVAKELKLTDEFMYRLNWYQEFTEYQLILFWHNLANDNKEVFNQEVETVNFKKNFYLMLLMNAEVLELEDDQIERMMHLTKNPLDDFDDYVKACDPCFYDYDYHFDGLAFEYIKNVLRKSATVVDIRNIASKYQINVPKRLKKDEFVALVAEGLRRQGKFDETTIDKLKKMSAISLQRFAKVNNIKASTEMKKDDVIEYVMNNIEKAPLVKHAPRVDVTLPLELTSFVFSKDFLREVNHFDDEDDAKEEKQEEVKEQETYIETVVEPEPQEVVTETPVEEPQVEEVQEEALEVCEEEPQEPAIKEQDLIEKIIKVLEEREEKEVKEEAHVQNNEELTNIIKMYEDRIDKLEKLIDDLRTNPIPVNVTVAYPDYPLQPIVISNDSKAPEASAPVETEIVTNAPVIETLEEVKEEEAEVVADEPLEPIVYDTAFDSLNPEEKKNLAHDLMRDSEAITPINEEHVSRKERKKARKDAKRQEKLEKIREKNEIQIYRRDRSRAVRRFIFGIIWVVILTVLALFIWMILYDQGILKDFVSESMNDMFSKIPGFARDDQMRTWIVKAIETAKGWFVK